MEISFVVMDIASYTNTLQLNFSPECDGTHW